jgi:hypothetical protein
MIDLLYAVPASSAARLKFLTEGAGRILATGSQSEGSMPDGPDRPDRFRPQIELLMADHSIPVCGHTGTMSTLWSAVAQPARKRIAYCLGAPCENPFSHGASWE